MLVSDSDEPALKSWLEKRLAKISDAEAPILAEYCIALLKHDQSEDQVRDLCVDQLSDFLRGDTKAFVNDVFGAIKSRTFGKDGSLKVMQPRADLNSKIPAATASAAVSMPATGPQSTIKIDTRLPAMPLPPAEMLNDPAFMMHMQQMARNIPPTRRKRKHCFAFEQRGFCNKGAACPYEHVSPATQPDRNLHEYDPNFSAMGVNSRGSQPFVRATYQAQNSHDNSNGNAISTTNGMTSNPSSNQQHSENILALKNIPPEAMNENSVRQYFSVFGPLAYVHLNNATKSANIKFIDPENAAAAYASPAPIFNNRFVKLYWLKVNANSKTSATKLSTSSQPSQPRSRGADEMEVDTATIETLQREHDERMIKKKEFDERAAQLAAQKAELQRRQDESREALKRLQSAPNGGSDVGGSQETLADGTNGMSSDRYALEAQLAQLKAKASALGLTPEDLRAPSSPLPQEEYYNTRGRGRGRGRGGRGRGYAPTYTRGTSGSTSNGLPYARRTLDLRPRTLRIETLDDAASLEAEIRANTEYEVITRPDPRVLQVTFKTRRDAEVFSARPVGQMSWVKENQAAGTLDVAAAAGSGLMMVDENHNRYDD